MCRLSLSLSKISRCPFNASDFGIHWGNIGSTVQPHEETWNNNKDVGLMAKGCTLLGKKHVFGLFLWKVNQLAFFRFEDPVILHFLSLPPSYLFSKNFSCKPKTSSALLSYIRRGIRSEVWIQWPRTLMFVDHSHSSKILKLRWHSS